MLPKFGTTTNPIKGVLNEIALVEKNNFDYVEISIEPQVFFSNQILLNRSKINKILSKRKMFVVVHAPWNSELGSPYKEVREGWFDFCKNIINMTKPIGIKKLNVHLYAQQNLQSTKIKNLIIENYIRTLEDLVSYGEKNKVQIVLELMPGKEQIYKFSDIKKILDSVSRLGLTFDSGHCFVNGKMAYTKKFLSTFKDRITHVHLHDNHGERDEHIALGKGLIDFKSIAKIFRQINYSETITFETFHSGVDKTSAVKSKNYFIKLLDKY